MELPLDSTDFHPYVICRTERERERERERCYTLSLLFARVSCLQHIALSTPDCIVVVRWYFQGEDGSEAQEDFSQMALSF